MHYQQDALPSQEDNPGKVMRCYCLFVALSVSVSVCLCPMHFSGGEVQFLLHTKNVQDYRAAHVVAWVLKKRAKEKRIARVHLRRRRQAKPDVRVSRHRGIQYQSQARAQDGNRGVGGWSVM